MNRILTTAVLAGLASAAAAQSPSVTIHFDADGDPLTGSTIATSSATISVYASFSGFGSTAYFGGFVGSFVGSGVGTVSNVASLMAGNGTTATADGNGVGNINMFHSALLGTDDPSNPLAIMTFDVSDAAGLDWDVLGTASMFADDGIFTLPQEFVDAEISVISDYLWVPTPAAATLLAGGLVTARRRR